MLGNSTKRWNAVLGRDRSADGSFVFGVRTTGIYCRPSCPARRPERRNVQFFAAAAAAEKAGFRPCRRCSPNTTVRPDRDFEAVEKICRIIEARVALHSASADGKSILAGLAKAAGLSRAQMERAFRRVLGISPRQYADARRMKQLKCELKKGDGVTGAVYEAGFGSSSRVYERAAGHLGMTPATYRKGGEGMNISYAIVESPLGRMLVGGTDRGISALYLGDSDSKLEAALREEYPQAKIQRGQKGLTDWIRKIVAHLQGREPHLDLPTDVRATAFKRRVWEELRKIPYGETRTYSEVAKAIGKPAAIRAVASACATNPVSVVVPCHRVVRKSGNLAGYRWGLQRKEKLLKQERGEN